MSGIRGSLVFLLLMVSVISIFVLNRWKRDPPGCSGGVPRRGVGIRISEQETQRSIQAMPIIRDQQWTIPPLPKETDHRVPDRLRTTDPQAGYRNQMVHLKFCFG